MFWSIDNDDFRGACHDKPYPLIEAAKESYYAKLGCVSILYQLYKQTNPKIQIFFLVIYHNKIINFKVKNLIMESRI